ncbi:MAG: tRNA threonylcarbamoyladenosine dehydratase [Bacteroidia bacterium]|nr:tRNA threonylcarbamoyladenosine dehydratase [Bacteroidia bacterium]
MSDWTWLGRTELLLGKEVLAKFRQKHILVVGLGGVGSFAAEFICRSGIGKMTIVDGDVVDPTNRNRQLPALATTHGVSKAEWMANRLLQINPELELTTHKFFLNPDQVEQLLETPFDYVLDCIDSVTPKVTLITLAYQKRYKIVSSMGAGGKLDPTKIKIGDISQTNVCKLASHVRKRLRKRNIYHGVKAVYSTEPVLPTSLMLTDGSNYKKSAYGTISYLPALFGCVCASVAIRDLAGIQYPLE